MQTIKEENKILTPQEEKAIVNINEALDFDADPGLWDDCGEVDVPVLLDAVQRLVKELEKFKVENGTVALYVKAQEKRMGEIRKLVLSPLACFEEISAEV